MSTRLATADDARRVWTWRNDPRTRSMSRDSAPVPWSRHLLWFRQRLSDPDTLMLMGLSGDAPCGIIRFDRGAEGSAVVSVNLAPEFRSRGLGRSLLDKGCRIAQERGFALSFDAEIKTGNVGSRRIFEAVGFAAAPGAAGWLHYRRDVERCAP